jgi:hypothetical protein
MPAGSPIVIATMGSSAMDGPSEVACVYVPAPDGCMLE